MKNIYINGRFLTQPLSGMQRYAGELVSALDRLLGDSAAFASKVNIKVLVPHVSYYDYEWKHIEVKQVGMLKGHFWEQINLAWYARNGILINLTACGPLFHNRSILVLHDAAIFAHPEHFSFNYRVLHTFLRPRLARKAIKLVTISDFSKRELSHYCNVPESKFEIIGDSAEHIVHGATSTDILSRHDLISGAYALTVGNQSPNKNIALAISAFQKAAPEGWVLAVVGSSSDKIFGSAQITEKECVKRIGRVSDSELKALYENAGLFLFPSRYEGFGVPPLEAMILGCPVLSSNSSAMPEVLDDAAVYFENNDLNDFSEKINTLISNSSLRNDYISRGHERAKLYSWNTGAKILLNEISDLINNCEMFR